MISGFKKKLIVSKLSFGQTFRQARKKMGVSLKEVAQATLIRLSHLNDLEHDNFSIMPQEPYGSFFVKKYAAYLGLSTKKMTLWYLRVANINQNEQELQVPQELEFSFFGFLRSRLKAILIGLVLILVVFSFMAYEVASMAQGPKLSVVEPSQKEISTNLSTFKIRGIVDEESSVYIDGEIVDQTNGIFEQEVILQKGMNKIEIEAHNNLGKSTIKVFYILRK